MRSRRERGSRWLRRLRSRRATHDVIALRDGFAAARGSDVVGAQLGDVLFRSVPVNLATRSRL
jgi:hypothetical protein